MIAAALGPLAVFALLVVLALVLFWALIALLARRPRRKYQYIVKPTRFDLEERRDVDALMRLLEKREAADGAMQGLVRMTRDGDPRLTRRIVKALMARCIEADPALARDWKDYGAGMARRTLIECGAPAFQVSQNYLQRTSPKTARATCLVLAGLRARGEVNVPDELVRMVEVKGGVPWSHWERLAEAWLAQPEGGFSLPAWSTSQGAGDASDASALLALSAAKAK
jgi:hypothetical protein